MGQKRDRRTRAPALDGVALAGLGQNGHEGAGRVDARRPRSGEIPNAIAQAHLGGRRPRSMKKPTLDHIGIAVRSLESAKIYEDLGLTIEHVETVETQR